MNLWMFDKTHYVKYARVRVFSDIFLAVIILHIRILSPKLAKHNLTHFWPLFPLYAPKNTENQRFSGVFRGCKMGKLARNGLN